MYIWGLLRVFLFSEKCESIGKIEQDYFCFLRGVWIYWSSTPASVNNFLWRSLR